MRVKELIEKLQKFDPEAKISEAIYDVDQLPAFYDGSCCYYDAEQHTYNITRTGMKIVFRRMEIDDMVLDMFRRDSKKSFEDVAYHFRGVSEEYLKEKYDYWKNHILKSDQEWLEKIKQKISEGCRFLQERDGYIWSQLNPDGTTEGLMCGFIHILCNSGCFERIDYEPDPTYVEWVYK